MGLRKINEEVYVADGPIARVGPEDVALIKAQARRNPRGRARLCAHQSNEDALHEMIIAVTRDSYIHPHRHVGKSESFHIIEGLVDVVIYDDAGTIVELIPLGDHTSHRQFYYRLQNERFHGLIIHSDVLVFHEVTNGPFSPNGSRRAPFAPDESDRARVVAYMNSARAAALHFVATTSGDRPA